LSFGNPSRFRRLPQAQREPFFRRHSQIKHLQVLGAHPGPHETDRQSSAFANVGQQGLGGPRVLKSIDHRNSLVANDESGIATGQSRVIDDCDPNAGSDLLKAVVRSGSLDIRCHKGDTSF
jgi:hypothetical protein